MEGRLKQIPYHTVSEEATTLLQIYPVGVCKVEPLPACPGISLNSSECLWIGEHVTTVVRCYQLLTFSLDQ